MNHLEEQNIGYWTHLVRVFKASFKLLGLSFAGFVHGVFPSLCINTVSLGIKEVEKELMYFPKKRKKSSS